MRHIKQLIVLLAVVIAMASLAWGAATHMSGPVVSENGFKVGTYASSNSVIDSNRVINGTTAINLEGSTADAYETTISPTDPTADRTITLPDSNQTVGTATTVSDDPTMSGSVGYSTATATAAGPTDNFDVTSANVVLIDTGSNNVVLGGFAGGVAGQVLHLTVVDKTNNATLENNEGGGSQDIYLSSGGDETVATSYGGWTLVCNGTDWFEVDQ